MEQAEGNKLTKEVFIENLLKIDPSYNTENIERAFVVADKMHEGQFRQSGDPYISHPVNVAYILAKLGMDEDTVIGGLLHDVVEDTDYTEEQLKADFGEEVCALVDGVTKLGNIKFESKENIQAENFRKMFLAMSRDIRVLVIKLADRLHNMRTLQFKSPEKIKEKATETLEIYAPLAARLGIFSIKFELEDLALKFLHPEEYEDLVRRISQMKTERETVINNVIAEIKESLDDMG
ncbi:MAG: bifunctional (p)ppGpp synthetase/guanosine-3',5'-bis(diphosphate) 3'-pyrophosphohydrolase, partial [Firmicutes bacterium]|nr:bifunctional (p)ppGpp synthetase/guanosine-3',5'-bis(diphosphate) 3'-pyrophosphohydrolase [Bacillota bacterium]